MSSFDITDSECNICFTQSYKWQLLPCKHKLCKKCYNLLQDNKCPWCRIKIKKYKASATSARTRSYSDPLHNRDALRTPIDVIEHENRIERYMDRKKVKRTREISKKLLFLPRDAYYLITISEILKIYSDLNYSTAASIYFSNVLSIKINIIKNTIEYANRNLLLSPPKFDTVSIKTLGII